MRKNFSVAILTTIFLGAAVSNANALMWTFTAGGSTGATGPSQSALDSTYLGTNLEGSVTSISGVQNWYTPYAGEYRITATGAQGASGDSSYVGGRGAQIIGDFLFSSDYLLQILVGQMGVGQSSGSNGGGGGGSFVVDYSNSPLIIAGGGGGTRTAVNQNGTDASITEYSYNASGSSASYTPVLKTSDDGQGGIASSHSWGSGGAGFYGNGENDSTYGEGGFSWINGGIGGGSSDPCSSIGYGGFGGGGAGNGCFGGGGGGGYSGGDGGRVAGGGGSFNAGYNQFAYMGMGYGDGLVTVEYLGEEPAPVPEPATMLLFGTGLAGFAAVRRKRRK